jgi:meso-butanediol dehydrogenase/(S,S)-butanediol dehydrogenase/diacetyl reductase
MRVVVVTGAASGIGAATAARFEAHGDEVVRLDRTPGEGIVECDVTDAEQVRSIIGELPRIDVLANVAGVMRFGRIGDLSMDDWDFHIAVNLTGPMLTMQAALPQLTASRGHVVNVASIAGLKGQAYTAAYCASKGGLVLLTKSAALEWGSLGIRVNCVCPAGVDTPLTADLDIPADLDPAMFQRLMGPLGMTVPAEVADLIVHIAGTTTMTGAAVVLDGGVIC